MVSCYHFRIDRRYRADHCSLIPGPRRPDGGIGGPDGSTIVTGNVDDGTSIGSEVVGKELRNAADDPMVEAIVLRVNSPGDACRAEEIIRDLEYAKTKKPVVVSMGDMATSAAYYVSAHADRIYADPGTFTAAVGVLWEFSDTSGWMKDQGYNETIVKSGARKDMGNPSPPTTDEQAYAQQIVNESFNTFINDVTTQRAIARSDIADGRVIQGCGRAEDEYCRPAREPQRRYRGCKGAGTKESGRLYYPDRCLPS